MGPGLALGQSAEDVPIGGYQPQVLFTLTDEFKTDTDDLFFIADNDTTFDASRAISGTGSSPHFEVGLFDTGAQINLLQRQAFNDFGILTNGFAGTEQIPIGGVAGTEVASIEDPLGLFATGFQNRTSPNAGTIAVNQSTLVGQTSVSVVTAGSQSALPNVVGLPVASQYTTIIRSSAPQIFTDDQGNTVRSPSVEFDALGTGADQGIDRRVGLTLEVSPIVGTTQPTYIFNTTGLLNGDALHDNPASPTLVAGGFFLDVNYALEGTSSTADVFFDSGAQVSVVSETFAAQLGFDAVLDEPDFTVPILGAGGQLTEVPGFIADTLSVNSVGGIFEITNVPVVVLDVPNPTGSGAVDGILGTNAFSDRDIVIDPAGNRLWISDSVLETHDWASGSGSADWNTAASWTEPGTPDALWRTNVVNAPGQDQTAVVSSDSTVHNVYVAGNAAGGEIALRIDAGNTLTTFAESRVADGGTLVLNGGTLDTTQLELGGGTLSGGGVVRGSVENRGRLENGGIDISLTYLQDEAGTLVVQSQPGSLAPATLNVAGTASIEGGVLAFDLDSSFTPDVGEVRTILDSDGLTGTFGSVVNAVSGSTMWSLIYGASSVSVEALLTGDLNGDGRVAQMDLDLVLLSWGQAVLAGVAGLGDASGDGVVSQADLDLVLLNWGAAVAPALTQELLSRAVSADGTAVAAPNLTLAAFGSVPEPTTGWLVVLGAWGAMRRRRSAAA